MSSPREEELLAADRFAGSLGIGLVSASSDRVVVSMEIRPDHVNAAGRLHAAVAFTLADCAMSLISNASARAFAVSAHLVAPGRVTAGQRLQATAVPAHRSDGRVSWQVAVTSPEGAVASFTGTTIEVPA